MNDSASVSLVKMWYLLLVVCCSLVLWRLWFKKSHLEPPVLPGWLPIIGHGHRIMGSGEQLHKAINRMGEECTAKGGVALLYFGLHKVYTVTDPEDSLTVLNACFQKHFFVEFLKPILGNGIVIADVPTWKRNRKLLNPAFNQQVLDGFIEIFNTQAERLVEQFTKKVGKPFDQGELLRPNNLQTICSTTLGVYGTDLEFSDLFTQYIPRLLKILKLINERIQKIWFHSDFIYNMTREKKQMDIEIKSMTELSHLILKKKLEKRNQEEKLPSAEMKSAKCKPFINLILDLAEETGCFTDEQIKWEIETIIATGHNTVTCSLTFTLALLGSYADVQEKAYQEVLHIVGKSDKRLGKEDLNKFVYIEAILKEILRLYESVAALPRHLDKDVKLKNYTIKAHSDCFIFLHGLHRHCIWGPDADKFRPERWLDKETLPDTKYYGAFGMGRRSCIGKSYAMMVMKIVLVHVVRKFHITSDISEMVTTMHSLIEPSSGHHISLALRNT